MNWLAFAVLTATLHSASPKPATDRLPSPTGLALTIREITRDGKLTVDIRNVIGRPIKVWRDSNSWGASRWRVLRFRSGQLETFYQKPDRDFMVNGPQVFEIPPGQHVMRALDLNGEYWCKLTQCTEYHERRSGDDSIRFEPGDLVVVIYDVPFTPPESGQFKAWYGVVAASTTVR